MITQTTQLISVNPSKTLIPIEELIRLAEQDLEKSRRQGIKDRNKKPEPQVSQGDYEFILLSDPRMESFREAYHRELQGAYQSNTHLAKLSTGGVGSSPLINGLVRKVCDSPEIQAQFPGIRPFIPKDLAGDKLAEFFPMIEGKHYSDFNAFDVFSAEDSEVANRTFLESLISEVEHRVGSVEFPFRVTGFYVEPVSVTKDASFQLAPVPTQDFNYQSFARKGDVKFNLLDSNGFPIEDTNGRFTWYKRNSGLSRVYLNRGGNLNSLIPTCRIRLTMVGWFLRSHEVAELCKNLLTILIF